MKEFDVAILGGGHAGLEAAFAVAQFSLKVALISMKGVPLGSAPCNPAVGGVGKGQLVREIDAMGGLMGKLADGAAIQCRTLNASKGPAVQSTRFQIDKEVYSALATEEVKKNPFITYFPWRIEKMGEEAGLYFLENEERELLWAKKVIITAGTFLEGNLHVGEEKKAGGRFETQASSSAQKMKLPLKVLTKKFKTGTPPRLKESSIDFSQLEEQPSDDSVVNFHWNHSPNERFLPQRSCFLTETNEKTLSLIRENKERSPMYNGQIQGMGPRYCPSIEDKAFRYPERNEHHLFVEPEGLKLESWYPNGISTSLPREVQEKFVHTIKGFEKAEILVAGYAVEYQVVDTSCLDETLQVKDSPGLYCAGQINGTSGYEEAAAQGMVAGLNASLALLGRSKLIFSRYESYIGVLIDDLVHSSRDEPYRLFTARAENRLYLREDNVFCRMVSYRKKLYLNLALDTFYEDYEREKRVLGGVVSEARLELEDLSSHLQEFVGRFYRTKEGKNDKKISLKQLLAGLNSASSDFLMLYLKEEGLSFIPSVVRTVGISSRYESFIEKALKQYRRLDKLRLSPLNWERWATHQGVSHECRERIAKIRPQTFAALSSIEGIRTSTLALVASSISS